MTRALLIVSLFCPLVAAAQTAAGRWSIEAGPGLTAAPNGSYTQSFGAALAFVVDRALSQRVALRFAADWGAFRPAQGPCALLFCNLRVPVVMWGISGGIMAARSDFDSGLYTTARAGLYTLGTEPGIQPGGYLGAGLAKPTGFGAITFEVGVHGYLAEAQRSWMVPFRVGLRWRP